MFDFIDMLTFGSREKDINGKEWIILKKEYNGKNWFAYAINPESEMPAAVMFIQLPPLEEEEIAQSEEK